VTPASGISASILLIWRSPEAFMTHRRLLPALICCLLCPAAFAQDDDKSADPSEDIRELKLRDWQPRSMLKTKITLVSLPAFPVIDVHNHLGGGAQTLTPERVRRYLSEMDAAGVRTVINLDGGWDERLQETLAALDEAHPDRFLTFALIDFQGFDEEGWSERETARLRKSFEAGAKGLKFHKSLGLSYRDQAGKLLGIDDPRLDPIWTLCGEMRRPVMIHTADPATFFTPLDRFNERWHELNDHPNWLFHGDKFPSREELLEQRNRVIARHPKTTFIGAHFGNNPENLEAVGKWLDMYPNFHVDIDARISELGRQPYSARRFFLSYQNRILFGTDTTPKADAYRLYYRFLETDDEYFDTAQSHHRQGFWMIYGIFLPDDVLQKIYYTNAARLLGLNTAE
jgi:predicted TIM-barrel fold metal-dependent hydrolase